MTISEKLYYTCSVKVNATRHVSPPARRQTGWFYGISNPRGLWVNKPKRGKMHIAPTSPKVLPLRPGRHTLRRPARRHNDTVNRRARQGGASGSRVKGTNGPTARGC